MDITQAIAPEIQHESQKTSSRTSGVRHVPDPDRPADLGLGFNPRKEAFQPTPAESADAADLDCVTPIDFTLNWKDEVNAMPNRAVKVSLVVVTLSLVSISIFFHGYHLEQFDLERRRWLSSAEAFGR